MKTDKELIDLAEIIERDIKNFRIKIREHLLKIIDQYGQTDEEGYKVVTTPCIELFGGGIDAFGLDPKTGIVEIYELDDDGYAVFEEFNKNGDAFAEKDYNPDANKEYHDLKLYHFDDLHAFVKYLYKFFPLD